MFNSLINKLNTLEPLIKAVSPDLMAKANFLYDRISNPESFVVLLGETSSGKSSIINGLIDRHLLPEKATPSTASISEIVLKYEQKNDAYYCIYKDATAKPIKEDVFREKCEKADPELARLRADVKTNEYSFNNLTVIDTPGYGSTFDEHEEILKEFIPNSDVVVYTVLYKVGLQQYDYSVLSEIRELLREDTKIILAINRCPSDVNYDSDKRISEIKKYVSELFKIDRIFCINNQQPDESGHALPKCNELWDYIRDVVSSEEHHKILFDAFDGFIHQLYLECDSKARYNYNNSLLRDDEARQARLYVKQSADKFRTACSLLVEPAFSEIKDKLPTLYDQAETRIIEAVEKKISGMSKFDKKECQAIINHTLNYECTQQQKAISECIDSKLYELNRKLDDYINKEIILYTKLAVGPYDSNVGALTESLLKKYFIKSTGDALTHYCMKYAGAAGIRGGFANAASHSLKVAGNFFGKTFSKQTHVVLQRIGAASAKSIGAIIAAVVELGFLTYDLNTWKPKMKKWVKKQVREWKEGTLPIVLKNINDLKDTNISTLEDIAKQMETTIIDNATTDLEQCKNNVLLSDSIKKQLNY